MDNNSFLLLCLPTELIELVYDNIGNWIDRLSFVSTNSHIFNIAINRRSNYSLCIDEKSVRDDSKALLPMKTSEVIKFNEDVKNINIGMMPDINKKLNCLKVVEVDITGSFEAEKLIGAIIEYFLESQGIAFQAHYYQKRISRSHITYQNKRIQRRKHYSFNNIIINLSHFFSIDFV
jgi:hypothetical protein